MPLPLEKGRKLQAFLSQTGADPSTARQILDDHQWNLESAVKMYRFMQTAALPPQGPRKNMQPRNTNLNPHAVNPNAGGGIPRTGMAVLRPLGQQEVTATVGAVVLPSQQFVAPPSPSNSLTKKLKRGLSKTTENLPLVNKARNEVLNDITESADEEKGQHFVETPEYTFILPDLTIYSEDFRAFLHKDLIETSTLVSLEQAGRLNWWADMGACQRLLPLATTGDGNCLLHAASLGMWGFHDRLLTLRKALFITLNNCRTKSAIWRRWRWHQTQVNKESGLVYSEPEWQVEWENLLKLASTKPRTHPGSTASCCDSPATKGLMERTVERESEDDCEVFYESLEEFHVFILAHVLRRPIIVVADTILKDSNGEALAPIPFGGIYLPLECDPQQCHRSPLLLTYDASHFSALVAMETDMSPPEEKPGRIDGGLLRTYALPLVDPEFQLLPIHYMVDPGINFVWGKDEIDEQKTRNMELPTDDKLRLVKKYLDIECVAIPGIGSYLLPENEAGQEPRSRSNSNCGSEASDDTNSAGSNGNLNNKDKDKNKMTKQLNSITKSFGSIGKSMSKKWKKNFTGKGGEKYKRKSSVGSATQSTKRTSVTVEMLGERDHILCVKLSYKRADYQEEMVKNYIMAAEERFKEDRELRRKRDIEMRQKTELRRVDRVNVPPMQCVNPGCANLGSSATSYLCPACYEKEKQQALDFERRPASQGQDEMDYSAPDRALERTDTLVNLGKSKFYTIANEDHCLPQDGPNQGAGLNNAKTPVQATGREALHLARSSFYAGVEVPPSEVKRSSDTPYIVNNLYENLPGVPPNVKVDNKKYGTLPTRLPSQKAIDLGDINPEVDKIPANADSGPMRRSAFKIKDVKDDISIKMRENCSIGGPVQIKCQKDGCSFYGTNATDFLCSACFKERQRTLAYIAKKQGPP